MEEKVTATSLPPQPANIPIVRLEEMSNWQQLLDLLGDSFRSLFISMLSGTGTALCIVYATAVNSLQ